MNSMIQPDANQYLKASAAETADTNGTALDIGPLGLVDIAIVCTAGWATGTLALKFQQSDDDGSVDHYAHGENEVASMPATTGSAAGNTTADAFGGVGMVRHIPAYITKKYLRYASTHEQASGAVSKTYQILVTSINR